jgi:hypothetical protein
MAVSDWQEPARTAPPQATLCRTDEQDASGLRPVQIGHSIVWCALWCGKADDNVVDWQETAEISVISVGKIAAVGLDIVNLRTKYLAATAVDKVEVQARIHLVGV